MSNDTLLNNRYRLIQQIGSGGMAVIYKAQDLSLGRTVAIKILRPSLTSDASFAARFKNEARSVANLSHPNIVTVYDFGTSDNTQFLVMEFVDGQDLKKVIKTESPLTLDRVLNFAIQICAGIGFAHRAGIVHADIKPQNILVTREDVLKVTDFGIAQALASGTPGERQAVVWGSPHYFSPEQARGERPTTASDVYSIGIVMFEMLAGRPPYSGKDQRELALAHLQSPVPMVTEINPNVPPNLAQIIYRTMGKDPSQRYRMADQLGNVLKSYQERERGGYVSTPPPMPPVSAAAQMPPPQPVYPQQPVDPVPTQRVDLAPNPPRFGGYAPPVANPYPVQNSAPISQPYNPQAYNSQAYSAPYTPRDEQPRSSLDIPTIVLALLAFMSVACLIPLYIAVFQARF